MAVEHATRQRVPRRRVRLTPEVTASDQVAVMASAAGLTFLAGLWLAISPWILAYGSGERWIPLVSGGVILLVSLLRPKLGKPDSWMSGVILLTGIWLFLSAFWFIQSSTATWNAGILGVIVFVLGAWAMSDPGVDPAERERLRRRHTWRRPVQ